MSRINNAIRINWLIQKKWIKPLTILSANDVNNQQSLQLLYFEPISFCTCSETELSKDTLLGRLTAPVIYEHSLPFF